MKTLDEVIKAVEEDLECANESYPEVFYDYDNHKDALHYLKEYKGLSNMWNDKLDKEQENPPLDWETLKQMEGKPVWVEYEGYAPAWEIIEYIGDTKWKCGEIIETHLSILHKENQGKTWNAFRKERE